MARASKSKGTGTGRGRGKRKSKAPGPVQDTTLTPEAEDEDEDRSGVHFEPGDDGPTFDRPLNVEERAAIADELATLQVSLAETCEEYGLAGRLHRAEVKRVTKRINRLALELTTGVRKEPAQAELPHVDATPEVVDATVAPDVTLTAEELAAADAAFEPDLHGGGNGVTPQEGENGF
jgi:hypothetical protein